tara:strand:- start:67 stop:471 length:405 start_codon:yes stop_codon:yes gene_type:complete
MYKHTFTFKLQKDISSKSARDKLLLSIKNALLFSDQYTFGKNLTITKPIININKNKVTVSVVLFKQFKDSLFKTAKNKFLKYLNKHRGYQFEEQKYNLYKKKVTSKLSNGNKKKTVKKPRSLSNSKHKKTSKKK